MDARPSSRLSSAISVGSLFQTLSALQSLEILDVAHTPRTSTTKEEQSVTAYEAALRRVLSYTIPVALLSQALSKGSALCGVVATLRANLGLLPSLRAPPRPLDHLLAVLCDGDDLDAASTALAQRAHHDTEELALAWNAVAPTHAAATAPELLPRVMHAVRAEARCARQETVGLDAAVTLTRRTAVAMLHAAMREAVSATEQDTGERARDDAYDAGVIRLMDERGAAIAAKMRLVRSEVAARTYSEGAVGALKEISTAVTRRTLRVQHDLETKTARLAQYHALGKEFELVVEEFVRVRAKLEHLAWSKRELGIG